MTALTRDAIFISHTNPEDNEFTVWLGARLTAAGYEVWADVLRLRGGQDWQRLLEDALRNKACKVLLVGTEHGVQKQGVRNEIQIAHAVSRSIGDRAGGVAYPRRPSRAGGAPMSDWGSCWRGCARWRRRGVFEDWRARWRWGGWCIVVKGDVAHARRRRQRGPVHGCVDGANLHRGGLLRRARPGHAEGSMTAVNLSI